MYPELIVFVALCQAPQAEKSTALAPHVLLKEDALFSIRGDTKRMVLTTDLDGDGLRDLVLCRGRRNSPPTSDRIEAVSSKDGHLIRTYWEYDNSMYSVRDWDAGEDVDGDGSGDVLLGMPWARGAAGMQCGRIAIVSGSDGNIVWSLEGRASHDNLGYGVAFLGDLDRDGKADLAVGAPQLEPRDWADEPPAVTSNTAGRAEDLPTRTLAGLDSRRGYVTVRSGCESTELYCIAGAVATQGFGVRVVPTGDVDQDAACDWIVRGLASSSGSCQWISGKTAALVGSLPHGIASIARAGDIDVDGYADILVDQLHPRSWNAFAVRVISGRTNETIWEIRYPDWMSKFTTAVALGDVDGDGRDDVGIGDGNFHVRGQSDAAQFSGTTPTFIRASELRAMSVAQALSIESSPRFAALSESGCALIYSGRTHDVIFGVFGEPGSIDGIGLTMAALPDINGDGWPDVAIGGRDAIYVFAGPGLSASRVK